MELRIAQTISAMVFIAGVGLPRSTYATHADAESTLTILVRIDDKAGVPGFVLKSARGRATDVFRMSGVRVEWIDGEKANRLKIVAPYTIVIVPEPLAPVKAQAEHLGTDVMGQAAPVVGRAYIYYDRILRILTPSHDIVTTLGDVMAHELGHLVLPIGHSLVGIMRPTVNMRSRRVETFTEVEAGEIHARLRERTNIEPRTPNREPNLNTN